MIKEVLLERAERDNALKQLTSTYDWVMTMLDVQDTLDMTGWLRSLTRFGLDCLQMSPQYHPAPA